MTANDPKKISGNAMRRPNISKSLALTDSEISTIMAAARPLWI
jgi:hypothetical protein